MLLDKRISRLIVAKLDWNSLCGEQSTSLNLALDITYAVVEYIIQIHHIVNLDKNKIHSAI